MALAQCSFFSDVLGLTCSMNVIIPQRTKYQIGMEGKVHGGKFPVLYLLHGLSDDHSIWLRRTSIERYAAEYGIAVVMPTVQRGFYTDMKTGGRYWTFISEELPEIAGAMFPLSEKREDTFAAGLSMGGYGAFKLALKRPDRYAAAASLSGALDIQALYSREETITAGELKWIFGTRTEAADGADDLFRLAKETARLPQQEQPQLFQCCGTEDFLYADNQSFRAHADGLGLRLHYEESPGTHEWGYWDAQIQRVLQWLPIRTSQ
ncbi:esterase family protein [Paenibacillus pasadenensis]|uniref:alpha/beta hydrolase n=1 Tax=Paenibacillus pasadenensis TaxID=217090 RepID=UPI00203FB33C|nr:alpha/beta hydrolase family protein [Paenibacillus pasadenensis]MCM3748551.1 esterase family protein [Paenibacillus pasadenensis]